MDTQRRVLVTGCSSGIGAVTARMLQEAGFEVWASARDEGALQALTKQGMRACTLDLGKAESVEALAAQIQEDGKPLYALVNNAGFQIPGAAEDLSRDALRYQFEVNVFGTVQLSNLLLKPMLAVGIGKLVFVSSVFGFSALPYRAAYVTSKYAIEGYVNALRLELWGTGVQVACIRPGPVATDFRKNSKANGQHWLDMENSRHSENYKNMQVRLAQPRRVSWHTSSPERVARCITSMLKARRMRRYYYIGSFAQGLRVASHLAAVVRDRFLLRVSAGGRV